MNIRLASLATIRQVPTPAASPRRRLANALGGFAINTNCAVAIYPEYTPRALHTSYSYPPESTNVIVNAHKGSFWKHSVTRDTCAL